MSWYRTGTVAVTNGSAAVAGTGTAWTGQIIVGSAILLPDARIYEITAITAAGALTIAPNYLGPTASGQAYAVLPTQGWALRAAQATAAWIAMQQGYIDGPLAGRFGDGTPALPSVAFAGDLDTGLIRPAADTLGLVTGGTVRARLGNSTLQLDIPLTGTAVQAGANDGITGLVDARLVRMDGAKTACLALGGPSYQVAGATIDIDALPAGSHGLYRSGFNVGTFPPWTSPQTNFWSIRTEAIYSAGAGSMLRQTAIGYRLNSGSTDTVIIAERLRASIDGHWTQWVRLLHNRNAVGTVSQSGGVPTGALIERGSNANGDFVRFADGTQICWCLAATTQTTTEATGSGFRATSGNNFVFPAAFTAPPVATPIGHYAGGPAGWATLTSVPSATAASARYYSFANNAEGRCGVIAAGRWF